ncbi:hypothetical protein MOSE0_N01156 [Monosporozyma servazzii]
MSLEELLHDDMFTTDQILEVDRSFDECVQYYIRGQYKDCLETLFKYDLIGTDRGQRLFNDACDGIPQFETLGISLHPFLDESFGNSHRDQYMNSLKIQDLNKYLKNCYKWIQWRGKASDPVVIETFKQSIESILSKNLTEENQTEYIYGLFKFYLVDVKLELLHEHKSVKLYERLCEKYPTLSKSLQEVGIWGSTYEEKLKDSLRVQMKKPVVTVKPEPISEPIDISNTSGEISKDTINALIQQYKQLIHHYMKLLLNSRYRNIITMGIIFSFILFYKCGKWTQKKAPGAIKWLSQWFHDLDQY